MTLPRTDLGAAGAPALVLLHAFPVNRHLWDGVAGTLADSGWRVIAPDLPGFGEAAPAVQPPDVAVAAATVFAMLDGLGVKEFSLGGLSMGGYVAMAVLRQQPDRVRSLFLVDTKMAADTEPARENRLAIADRALAEHSTEFLVDAMLPNLLGPVTLASRPHVVHQVSEWIRGTSAEGVAWAMRAMAARPDSSATLAGYPGPALVVGGTDDRLSPPDEQEQMAATLPMGQLELVPDVGHLSAIEDPQAVAAAMLGHPEMGPHA